ncbi:MAG: hypothetical protein QOE96_2303 [Blastocatellia bacterium]|jgi:hypothetical protein|nr:hypothetical protein [Blastocatellia bacterium]
MSKDVTPQVEYLYGGVSGVTLATDSFDLGERVEIRQTFAHLFSANMMAFARPEPGRHHPSPWRAAKGGFAYDIEVEIRAPSRTSLGESFDAKETIWWIAALLRMAHFPYLSVPVISNHSFSEVSQSDQEPTLTPFETEGRIFGPAHGVVSVLDSANLEWVRDKWVTAGKLLNQNPKFYSVLKAFDLATLRGRASSSLLAMWGGLEQIFAPTPGELRYRVAALMASYLEEHGPKRLSLYREILKLYNERCVAAHTAQEVETGSLVQTYVIMRNVLVKIVDTNEVPIQSDLEALLLSADSPL